MISIFRITLVILISFKVVRSQNNNITDFVPKGYVLFYHTYGDLNKDSLQDCVLIIKETDSTNVVTNRFDQVVDRNRLGIIVLFKNNNGYQIADKNYDCLSSENEDGGVYFPPELEIDISNNYLNINFLHGRYGTWGYAFHYQNENFELIEFTSSSNRGPIVLSKTYLNFITKKKIVNVNKNPDDEENELFTETIDSIAIENRIKLSEIEAFEDLDMYIY